jgi:hypothetical protein
LFEEDEEPCSSDEDEKGTVEKMARGKMLET